MAEKSYILTLVTFGLCLNAHTVSAHLSSGHAVYDVLFTNSSYNQNVRPVKSWDNITVVNASVSVIAIVDFNEVKQTIILTSKLTLSWKDDYLVWDPPLYGNVTHIHTPQNMVWRPSIFLENSVAKQQEFGSSYLKVEISHGGTVTWEPVEVFHATCAADVRKFPFDTQKCSMVFETMGYAGNEIEIVSVEDHIDFHGYGGTSGWTVTETHMEAEKSAEGKTHLLCSLTMNRNPTYFILNIFLPIVLLSFLNICVFILPVQSGEKASFVVTVFLSLAVFLTIVSSNLPENSDTISILNVYVFISTLLSVIIAIVTIVQVRIYHKDDAIPIPIILKKMVLRCTSKAKYRKRTPVIMIDERINISNHGRKSSIIPIQNGENETKDNVPEKNAEKQEVDDMLITWPDVARAFDNMMLVVFLTINIVMTVVIFVLAVRNEELAEDDNH